MYQNYSLALTQVHTVVSSQTQYPSHFKIKPKCRSSPASVGKIIWIEHKKNQTVSRSSKLHTQICHCKSDCIVFGIRPVPTFQISFSLLIFQHFSHLIAYFSHTTIIYSNLKVSIIHQISYLFSEINLWNLTYFCSVLWPGTRDQVFDWGCWKARIYFFK